jgi:hypothetical protein
MIDSVVLDGGDRRCVLLVITSAGAVATDEYRPWRRHQRRLYLITRGWGRWSWLVSGQLIARLLLDECDRKS